MDTNMINEVHQLHKNDRLSWWNMYITLTEITHDDIKNNLDRILENLDSHFPENHHNKGWTWRKEVWTDLIKKRDWDTLTENCLSFDQTGVDLRECNPLGFLVDPLVRQDRLFDEYLSRRNG